MGTAASVRQKRYKHRPHKHPALSVAESVLDYEQAEAMSDFDTRAMGRTKSEVAKKRAAARRVVRDILDKETAECRELWTIFEQQLRGSFPHWQVQRGQEEAVSQTKALLLAAVIVHDSTQVGIGMQRAAGLGLQPAADVARGLYKTLEDLLSKEDAHGLWICLASAIAEGDAISMSLWMDEAQEKKLVVPQPIHDYIQAASGANNVPHATSSRSMRGKPYNGEHVRITDWNYQEVFEDKVIDAYGQRDGKELRRLAEEARHFGGDPSMAEAALVALEQDEAQAAVVMNGGSLPAQRLSAPDPELLALRSTSVSALKAELGKMGADLRGVVEKEELVKMLQAMRRSNSSPPVSEPAGDSHRSSKRSHERRHHSRSHSEAPPSSSSAFAASPPRPSQSPPPFWQAASKERPRGPAQESSSSASFSEPKAPWQQAGNNKTSGPSASSSHGRSPRRSKSESNERNERSPPPPPAASKALTRAEALKCLGISSSDPTADEIRKAYKQAALLWHPDRQQNHERKEEATRKFQDTRAAFEFLRNGVAGSQ
mmetsp:Transcript_19984/g.36079  ORF Transcript_19984/g.36079 Transcript_19984/m.36079 type:complete len:544 (+) Transcript_19984:161-1792(+)